MVKERKDGFEEWVSLYMTSFEFIEICCFVVCEK